MVNIIVALVALAGTITSSVLSWYGLRARVKLGEMKELREQLKAAEDEIRKLRAELQAYEVHNSQLQNKNIALMERLLREVNKEQCERHTKHEKESA